MHKNKKSNTPKKDKGQGKLKHGIFHIVKKLYEQHPDAVLNYKQVCSLLHINDSETRKLLVNVLRDLCKEKFLIQKGHEAYQ
jgi:ribonuclease R